MPGHVDEEYLAKMDMCGSSMIKAVANLVVGDGSGIAEVKCALLACSCHGQSKRHALACSLASWFQNDQEISV
jgi:hypothetical protein